ncbi:toll/interleukin-1 receptor domain-containing protein [Candidatus Halobeggiatoa sp. HSG11]|nr:toll/interleukin-1 receptor domain-containing protein [Candidatus Halobeggiatoa sp. HSG11]
MTNVFVSHSSLDKYFVDLLVKILEYHYINVWYDSDDILIGDDYKESIHSGLINSDHLIVVASNNAVQSEWITKEITTFQSNITDEKRIIPLFIEDVNPDDIFDGLKNHQGILFYKNMLTGFQTLLNFLGKELLPTSDRREKQDRRDSDRRKDSSDRRKSLSQRLRIGLWKCYSDKTGEGKFDKYDLVLSNRLKVIDTIKPELDKYKYIDDNQQIVTLSQHELDKITYDVWEELGPRDYLTAIIVIECIAEKIINQYDVTSLDRRDNDRREEKDRRN